MRQISARAGSLNGRGNPVRIFGLEITRANREKSLSTITQGWVPLIREPYTGAWQRNGELVGNDLLSCFAVYACMSLISADIGKLRPTVQRRDSDGIWQETEYRNVSRLLRRPNRYQNHIQFKAYWESSLLRAGNVYVLKERDNSGAVVALYVLDPLNVTVLVSEDGSVYYRLNKEELSTVDATITVPASEIIHDRMCCLFHPLVGIPPLYANNLAASQGNKIQSDSLKFFTNGAKPGGLLVAPGAISDQTAAALKAYWDANYTGENSGKIAVVGDGLKFDPLKMTALDAQLVEQLKLTVDIVCSTYHVPAFKIGFGAMPSGSKIEDMNLIYYTDCLQSLIESFELCLGEGLELPDDYRIELDLTGLLRMDTATQYKTLSDGINGGLLKPDEARRKVNLPKLEGGDTIYMQQQNYSLAALAKRDARPDPFAPATAAVPEPEPEPEDEPDDMDEQARSFQFKSLELPAPRFQ